MKVTQLIQAFTAAHHTTTTQDILHYISAFGFTPEQVVGGIGYLRACGHLKIVTKLPYGHIFS